MLIVILDAGTERKCAVLSTFERNILPPSSWLKPNVVVELLTLLLSVRKVPG
jgi:hypothetical protein